MCTMYDKATTYELMCHKLTKSFQFAECIYILQYRSSYTYQCEENYIRI